LWLLKIKRFVHVHEIIDNPKIIGFVTALFSYLFANKIVCVSKAVQDGLSKYVKLTHKKSIVIHNGINPVEVTKFKERKNINFYLFGRIKPEKGQWFLIDTLATIPKEKLQNCKFILMGGVVDGQEDVLKRLQDKITIHGLNEYVFLRDFAPNIADAMSDADVCLIPSLMKDPFPTTVLEAMSAAKPVITTNHGGAKEAVLNNETGFLVSPNNTKELASSILYLIDRKTQIDEIGAKAKTHYQNFFTTEHFNTNWLNFNLNYQLI
jgi:glycosyltransferase involved in cell wall biosynthesis